jgi:hypothetical protein
MLMRSADRDNYDEVKRLIDKGADVNAKEMSHLMHSY